MNANQKSAETTRQIEPSPLSRGYEYMNLFQSANVGATFMILGALVAGLAKFFDNLPTPPIDYLLANKQVLYLGLFIVLFRVKTFIDDHKHFQEPLQGKNAFRYIGFMLAIISWVFWGMAAYLLVNTQRSSEIMATSILISTLWISVHVIEILVDKERRNKEILTSLIREKWVLINIFYMLLLVAHTGWFLPVIQPGPMPLLLLLGLLLLDVITSRSLREAVTPDP